MLNRTEKRREAASQFAHSNGHEFQPEFDRNELGRVSDINVFEGWTHGANLVRGRLGSHSFQLFDMRKVVTGTDSEGRPTSSTHDHLCVLVENTHAVPEVRLTASRGAVSKIFSLASRIGVEFEAQSTFREDTQVVSQFNKDYFAAGTGFEAGTEFRDTPGAVSLSLIKDLQSGRGWSIEATGNHILLHIKHKQAGNDDLVTIFMEAKDLLDTLQDPPRSGAGLMVRNLPPVGVGGMLGIVIWPFVGGVIGMLLTMIIYAGIFFAFKDLPTAVIFSFPVVGLVLMAGGALAMAKIRNSRS